VKWTVIVAAGAFVLALAGSTAFVVMRAPAPEPKAPATEKPAAPAPAVDSVAKSPAPAAVVASVSSAAAPVVTTVAPVTLAPSAVPVPQASPVHVPPAAVPPPAHATAPETPADYAQVAKMLISMKPAGATEIMNRLNDDQVEGILRALGVRQASTLLALLPGERAAVLSRRLMQRPAAGAR
jgi:hypothetical protein